MFLHLLHPNGVLQSETKHLLTAASAVAAVLQCERGKVMLLLSHVGSDVQEMEGMWCCFKSLVMVSEKSTLAFILVRKEHFSFSFGEKRAL